MDMQAFKGIDGDYRRELRIVDDPRPDNRQSGNSSKRSGGYTEGIGWRLFRKQHLVYCGKIGQSNKPRRAVVGECCDAIGDRGARRPVSAGVPHRARPGPHAIGSLPGSAKQTQPGEQSRQPQEIGARRTHPHDTNFAKQPGPIISGGETNAAARHVLAPSERQSLLGYKLNCEMPPISGGSSQNLMSAGGRPNWARAKMEAARSGLLPACARIACTSRHTR